MTGPPSAGPAAERPSALDPISMAACVRAGPDDGGVFADLAGEGARAPPGAGEPSPPSERASLRTGMIP